jgi:hypothetical protein
MMLFLIGERVSSKSEIAGSRFCAVCGDTEQFSHVTETNYFCLFGFPLLPTDKLADYYRCDRCSNAYQDLVAEAPSCVSVLQRTLSYIQLGYGQSQQKALVQDISLKLCGFDYSQEEMRKAAFQLETGDSQYLEYLRQASSRINSQGKVQIIEAAFLMTYVCCEIQYEDRLRVNLIGNALGVSLEFVEYAVQKVRQNSYYGVRRLVPMKS